MIKRGSFQAQQICYMCNKNHQKTQDSKIPDLRTQTNQHWIFCFVSSFVKDDFSCRAKQANEDHFCVIRSRGLDNYCLQPDLRKKCKIQFLIKKTQTSWRYNIPKVPTQYLCKQIQSRYTTGFLDMCSRQQIFHPSNKIF